MRAMEEVLRAWSDAEASGDVDALDRLLDAEFRGDGPAGQVPDRDGWLDASGAATWSSPRPR